MKRYLIICLMVISISTNSCISAEFAFSNSFTDLPNLFSSLQTNPNEIIAIATKEAEAGNEYAQLFLGSIYQDGNEVSEDFAKALFWYQKSAKQGNPYAMLSVGKFYHEGWVDNKKELVKALEIFNKLYAVSNENESLLISKYGLSGDNVKYLIKESAEYIADIYNNKSNQDLLAKWYNQNHVLSTTELDVEYAKWSIERGDSKNATYLILHLIEINEPSAKDLSQGFLKKFNRQPSYPPEIESYPKAIDEMLRNSRAFVKRNYELNPKNKTENKAIDFINNEAIKWLRIALNRGGDAWVKNSLAIRYENGDGVPKDNKKALQLFLEAAENGNVDAQFNLGTRYFEGRYGIRDFDKAEEWLTKAKNNGASDAVIFLSKLDDERQRIKEKQNGLIEIHAYDLLSEYIGNEINADAKFKSKILEIRGEVFSVSKGLTGGYYVILSDGFNATFRQIQCFFDEKEVSALQQLQAGYAAVIRGRCEGLMGNIILKDCIVIAR